MKKIYGIVLMLTLICCRNDNYSKVEYYENGNIKYSVTVKDGLYNGTMYTYRENGKLSSIQSYKAGKMHGDEVAYSENTYICVTNYYNDSLISQIVYDTITKRIQSEFRNKIAHVYNKNNEPLIINSSQDTNHRKFIKFTEAGKIRAYQGPLDFLTMEDSLNLTTAYPSWQEMIKEWEINKGNNPQ